MSGEKCLAVRAPGPYRGSCELVVSSHDEGTKVAGFRSPVTMICRADRAMSAAFVVGQRPIELSDLGNEPRGHKLPSSCRSRP